jgi:hypothetical protein
MEYIGIYIMAEMVQTKLCQNQVSQLEASLLIKMWDKLITSNQVVKFNQKSVHDRCTMICT